MPLKFKEPAAQFHMTFIVVADILFSCSQSYIGVNEC